jgi:hypothetical protein
MNDDQDFPPSRYRYKFNIYTVSPLRTWVKWIFYNNTTNDPKMTLGQMTTKRHDKQKQFDFYLQISRYFINSITEGLVNEQVKNKKILI